MKVLPGKLVDARGKRLRLVTLQDTVNNTALPGLAVTVPTGRAATDCTMAAGAATPATVGRDADRIQPVETRRVVSTGWIRAADLCRLHILLQRRHVDDVAESHFGLLDMLVGVVDLLDRDNLDVRADPVFGAEVQHLLRVGQVADQ